MWIIIIAFFILGLLGTISPKFSWYLSNWWKVEGNYEPSKASLLLYRFSGIMFLIIAIIIFIVKQN